jgi:hypothetical protein
VFHSQLPLSKTALALLTPQPDRSLTLLPVQSSKLLILNPALPILVFRKSDTCFDEPIILVVPGIACLLLVLHELHRSAIFQHLLGGYQETMQFCCMTKFETGYSIGLRGLEDGICVLLWIRQCLILALSAIGRYDYLRAKWDEI